MKENLINTSIVILANSHNPTVVSESFFLKTGIIKEGSELDSNNLFITPAFTQILFKNGVSFQLDPQRLAITSFEKNDFPFNAAQLYCKSLSFIKCSAIGINFEYEINEENFDNWLNLYKNFKFKDTNIKCIDFSFSNEDGSICLVKVQRNNNKNPSVSFNYHTEYQNQNKTLGEIDTRFLEKWQSYMILNVEFFKNLFV